MPPRRRRRTGRTALAVLGVTTALPLYLLLGGPDPVASAATRPVFTAAQQGVTCAMLPKGIRAQESGGNYRIRGVPVASHGGDRALGAYQVMPRNLPGWSQEIVGRRVSEREYMGSPALQDRIAGGKLAAYCRDHGPRGAAAMWFAGPENWRLHDSYAYRGGGATSVGAYVDSVMALARRSG